MPKRINEINTQYDPQQFQEKSTKMDTENWLPVKTDSHACIQYITDHEEENTQCCTLREFCGNGSTGSTGKSVERMMLNIIVTVVFSEMKHTNKWGLFLRAQQTENTYSIYSCKCITDIKFTLQHCLVYLFPIKFRKAAAQYLAEL